MEELVSRSAREAQRVEENALHCAKGHFAAAERWENVRLGLGIPATLFAALSGVSALKDFDLVAALLALGVTILSALSTFLNPNGRASAHLKAGNQYLQLRNEARVFREIELLAEPAAAEVKVKVQQLNDRRSELNSGSPQVPRWAYEEARKGIARGEAEYAVDRTGGTASKPS